MELPGQSTSFAIDECVICGEDINDGRALCTVRDKGATAINTASREREESLRVIPSQILHSDCRAIYINKKSIASVKKRKSQGNVESVPILRSKEPTFSFQNHCIFCGSQIIDNDGHRDDKVYPVPTWNCQNS